MKKKLTILGLFLLTLFLFPVTSHASSDVAYMVITNPGQYANTEMNVSWHMDKEVTTGALIYTLRTDETWANAVTVLGDYEEIDVFENRTFNHYRVDLKGLTPNTRYKYKITNGTSETSEYFFRTGGSREFSFAWIGDWHTYVPLPLRTTVIENLVSTMTSHDRNIQFILSSGDEVSYGNEYEAWLKNHGSPHFNEYMKASTAGNHDYLNNLANQPDTYDFFKYVHNFPRNGYATQEGVSYYFKYGNTLFVMMNSHDSFIDANPLARSWAKDVIDNNPSDFIVVVTHYNWFDGQSGNNYTYNTWKKFFDDNNVDLAISGHNHVYVRTHRLFNDQVNNEKGTVYMQTSSSDNDRGRLITGNNNIDKIAKRWTEGTKTIGGVIVTINDKEIKTKLIDRNGEIQDEGTISMRPKEAFDKNAFEESFNVVESTTEENAVIVSSSTLGAGNVEKIEYYNGDTLLGTNPFYQKDQSSYRISNATALEEVKVKITYKDRTVKELYLARLTNNFMNVSNVEVSRDEAGYKVTWEYQGDEQDAWVFIDDVKYKSVNLLDKYVNLGAIDPSSIVSIRPSENSENARYFAVYNTYGDANGDGLITEADVKLLQEYLFGNQNITKEELLFLDINEDGEIDLIDLTLIHLYYGELIQMLVEKEVTITFLDYYGRVIETKTVKVGDTVIPPAYELSGFEFITWDKDLSRAAIDLVVRPIMEGQ